MKATAKKILKTLVNNRRAWPIVKPLLEAGVYAYYSRKQPNDVSEKFAHILNEKIVRNGPFKGLTYPALDAFGSAIYPKLLGSYEKELHETINNLRKNKYSEIIDVGCAEGYYANGCSLIFPEAKVYAYDIDATARKLCHSMAKLNGVADRVEVRSYCSAEELQHFQFTDRGLIICDCEGYEMQLFNQTNINNLAKCDIIIEVHDFVNIEISGYLSKLFSDTHHIEIIKSVDDYEKAKTYQFNETESASLDDKLTLFREWRPFIMEWMICTPK
jgi:hypothetical protein